MTYSEVVHLLSSHMVPTESQQMIPLLEKFVNENHADEDYEAMDDSGEMDELDRDVNQRDFD